MAMSGGESQGFEEDGVLWMGTREELDAWKKYKKRKALAFVEQGYSVEWYPDGDGWMGVYHPERWYARTPELRADVKFFGRASMHGIDGGMISKLSIQETRRGTFRDLVVPGSSSVRTLYNYDRGLDIDHLSLSPDASRLYYAILEELN